MNEGLLIARLVIGLLMAGHGSQKAFELPLLYATSAVVLALTGPGYWSLDALLGLEFLSTPLIASTVLIAAAVGGFANLALRRTPATA